MLLGETPVVLLLAAEAASRQGDTEAARRAYAALLDRRDTEFLGLRGLIGQALRADDMRRAATRRARPRAAPGCTLAGGKSAAAAGPCRRLAGGARDAGRGERGGNALPAERRRHRPGVVLYELSRSIERAAIPARVGAGGQAQRWRRTSRRSPRINARLLFALGRTRAAIKAIERAWRTAPHPDLARLYLDGAQRCRAAGRAAALQRLAARNPEAAESHLAIAEAALAAQLWGEARRHLTLADAGAPPAGPSRRLCLLMARLEESEDGNAAAARDWLDRAIGAPPDPCYVCGQMRRRQRRVATAVPAHAAASTRSPGGSPARGTPARDRPARRAADAARGRCRPSRRRAAHCRAAWRRARNGIIKPPRRLAPVQPR